MRLTEEEIRGLYELDDWQQDDCPGSEQLAPCWHDLLSAARRIEVATLLKVKARLAHRGWKAISSVMDAMIATAAKERGE